MRCWRRLPSSSRPRWVRPLCPSSAGRERLGENATSLHGEHLIPALAVPPPLANVGNDPNNPGDTVDISDVRACITTGRGTTILSGVNSSVRIRLGWMAGSAPFMVDDCNSCKWPRVVPSFFTGSSQLAFRTEFPRGTGSEKQCRPRRVRCEAGTVNMVASETRSFSRRRGADQFGSSSRARMKVLAAGLSQPRGPMARPTNCPFRSTKKSVGGPQTP